MEKMVTLLVCLGFVYLASYAKGRTDAIEARNRIPKFITVWASHKAAIIADIYGLTPDDIAQPVNIFAEKE